MWSLSKNWAFVTFRGPWLYRVKNFLNARVKWWVYATTWQIYAPNLECRTRKKTINLFHLFSVLFLLELYTVLHTGWLSTVRWVWLQSSSTRISFSFVQSYPTLSVLYHKQLTMLVHQTSTWNYSQTCLAAVFGGFSFSSAVFLPGLETPFTENKRNSSNFLMYTRKSWQNKKRDRYKVLLASRGLYLSITSSMPEKLSVLGISTCIHHDCLKHRQHTVVQQLTLVIGFFCPGFPPCVKNRRGSNTFSTMILYF